MFLRGSKNFSLFAVIFSTFLAMSTTSVALADGEIVPVGAREIFIPNGFDDNDESILVLDGYLPSSCYKLSDATVEVDHAAKKVKVQAQARFYGGPCLLALVPYTKVVSLGVMPKGTFDVSTNRGSVVESLTVNESSNSGPDDYLYLPIDQATVAKNEAGRFEATLTGRFTSDCMVLKEIKIQNSGKTLEMLPIMEMQERSDCNNSLEIPFKEVVELPELNRGRYLLHVRSLNGKSENNVFSVE